MNETLKLMSAEQIQQATNYTLVSILIAAVAAVGLIVLAILLVQRMSRKITVVKKLRGDNGRFIDCKYRGKDTVHTLVCESETVYAKLKVGSDYVVKIRKNVITELCKTGDNKWKYKGKR